MGEEGKGPSLCPVLALPGKTALGPQSQGGLCVLVLSLLDPTQTLSDDLMKGQAVLLFFSLPILSTWLTWVPAHLFPPALLLWPWTGIVLL